MNMARTLCPALSRFRGRVLENRENSFLRPHVVSIMARPTRAGAVGFPLFRFHNKKAP